MQLIPVSPPPALERLVNLTVGRLNSANSKRVYITALMNFFQWAGIEKPLCWETINAYRAFLMESGTSGQTLNLRLVAVRKLCETAFLAKDITLDDYERIKHVKGVVKPEAKLGTWLTKEELQSLLDAPASQHWADSPATLAVMRDKALLGVLMGAGLRREELCTIKVESFRKVKGSWALADLKGKGSKTRTVPIGDWCATLIQRWLDTAALPPTAPLFPRLSQKGEITNLGMTGQNTYRIVRKYAKPLGFDVAPHDLRRSFARIAEQSGAKLRQISLSLGHSSVTTTEVYLGKDQDFSDEAPARRFDMETETKKDNNDIQTRKL